MGDKISQSFQRRTVLQSLGGVAAVSALTPLVQGRETYPVVDHELTNLPVKEILIDYDTDPNKDEISDHERIALSTTVFDQGFELYLATGIQSLSDTPAEVLQITSESAIGVMDLEWKNENIIEFWRDGFVYELKLPPSNKVFDAKELNERKIPNTVQDHGGDQ